MKLGGANTFPLWPCFLLHLKSSFSNHGERIFFSLPHIQWAALFRFLPLSGELLAPEAGKLMMRLSKSMSSRISTQAQTSLATKSITLRARLPKKRKPFVRASIITLYFSPFILLVSSIRSLRMSLMSCMF